MAKGRTDCKSAVFLLDASMVRIHCCSAHKDRAKDLGFGFIYLFSQQLVFCQHFAREHLWARAIFFVPFLTGILYITMLIYRISVSRKKARPARMFSIAMLDINNFKQINDVQGHAAGDQYLVNFVGILQEEMEKGTSLYRVGGDEFVVLSKKWDEGYLRQRLEHAREQAQIHHLFSPMAPSAISPRIF